jgi:hypothetical protein
LLQIDGSYLLLEVYISFVNVFFPFKIVPVRTIPVIFQFLLYKIDRDIQENVQIRTRQIELTIFCVNDPVTDFLFFLSSEILAHWYANIGIYISVQQDGASIFYDFTHHRCGTMPILCIEKCNQLRMDILYRTEATSQELANEVSIYRCIISREMDVFQFLGDCLQV